MELVRNEAIEGCIREAITSRGGRVSIRGNPVVTAQTASTAGL